MNTRFIAAKKILEWMAKQPYAEDLLRDVDSDRAAICERVLGVIRWHRSLRWMIDRYAQKPPDKRTEAVLAVGLYELCWMDEPPYATVNQCVSAAQRMASVPASRFVNAVLRRASQDRTSLLEALALQPPGIRFSFPEMLIERWTAAFGEEATVALCRQHNERADTVAHPLAGRIAAAAWVAQLKQNGIKVQPHPFRPDTYFILPRGIAVPKVPGFEEGHFIIQDPAAAPAVELLDPQPCERIWDACAAPGGKTLLIAERMKGKGLLVASDVQEERIARMSENMERAGADKVFLRLCDARRNRPEAGARYDGVLLDVPCTNTGVLRRRPDARWRFSVDRLDRILAMQRELLDGAADAVRAGGRLVYSTCSLEQEENRGQIEAFLERHPAFTFVSESRSFPPESLADGSYAALLKRI